MLQLDCRSDFYVNKPVIKRTKHSLWSSHDCFFLILLITGINFGVILNNNQVKNEIDVLLLLC